MYFLIEIELMKFLVNLSSDLFHSLIIIYYNNEFVFFFISHQLTTDEF